MMHAKKFELPFDIDSTDLVKKINSERCRLLEACDAAENAYFRCLVGGTEKQIEEASWLVTNAKSRFVEHDHTWAYLVFRAFQTGLILWPEIASGFLADIATTALNAELASWSKMLFTQTRRIDGLEQEIERLKERLNRSEAAILELAESQEVAS